jgi:hypothetical protein
LESSEGGMLSGLNFRGGVLRAAVVGWKRASSAIFLFALLTAGVSYSQPQQSNSSPAAPSDKTPAKKNTTSTTVRPKTATHTKSHTSAAGSSASHRSGGKTSASARKAGKKSRRNVSARSKGQQKKGQQKIDGERAQQIQTALIREHYMDGEPSGVWDDSTQQAMQRYQADHGWQSKTTPDARALIKLGLGPDQEHLLNPDKAMTSASTAVNSSGTNKATDHPAADSSPATGSSDKSAGSQPQQ